MTLRGRMGLEHVVTQGIWNTRNVRTANLLQFVLFPPPNPSTHPGAAARRKASVIKYKSSHVHLFGSVQASRFWDAPETHAVTSRLWQKGRHF